MPANERASDGEGWFGSRASAAGSRGSRRTMSLSGTGDGDDATRRHAVEASPFDPPSLLLWWLGWLLWLSWLLCRGGACVPRASAASVSAMTTTTTTAACAPLCRPPAPSSAILLPRVPTPRTLSYRRHEPSAVHCTPLPLPPPPEHHQANEIAIAIESSCFIRSLARTRARLPRHRLDDGAQSQRQGEHLRAVRTGGRRARRRAVSASWPHGRDRGVERRHHDRVRRLQRQRRLLLGPLLLFDRYAPVAERAASAATMCRLVVALADDVRGALSCRGAAMGSYRERRHSVGSAVPQRCTAAALLDRLLEIPRAS